MQKTCHDGACLGLIPIEVPQYRQECWKSINDVVSDERRLHIVWRDDVNGEQGKAALWSWPYDLAPLALGHVLLDIRPQGGVLVRQCAVHQTAEDEYGVTLGEPLDNPVQKSPQAVSGGALLAAMHSFIKAEGQWDGTGCFHRAGIYDPASGRCLARAEDIGRHNCLDRLAGWSAMNAICPADMVLLTTARITASLCAKALRAGFSMLVSRSAVTTAAIALAEERKVSLIGFARTDEERLTLFADPLGRIR